MTNVHGTPGESSLALRPGTMLRGQYRIERMLGVPGGFGIAYLATDVNLDAQVAVKEFLPRELAGREPGESTVLPHSVRDGDLFRYGLDKFVEEAKLLARLDHPNIVRVKNFFEANGTGYLVMDYQPGRTFADYLQRSGGRVGHGIAVEVMLRVLDGLAAAHDSGILHRDVKPENLYLTRSGRPLLLDFGAARQAVGERSQRLTAILTPGYAPLEQYSRSGRQGTWTDVYACAAVLYRAITGRVPPEASARIEGAMLTPPSEDVPDIPPGVDVAIVRGLELDARRRPQTAREFQDMLEGVARRPAAEPRLDSRPVHQEGAPRRTPVAGSDVSAGGARGTPPQRQSPPFNEPLEKPSIQREPVGGRQPAGPPGQPFRGPRGTPPENRASGPGPEGAGLEGGEKVAILAGNVCFTPLLGIILFFVWQGKKPKKSSQVCTLTWISLAIWVVIFIVSFLLGLMGAAAGA